MKFLIKSAESILSFCFNRAKVHMQHDLCAFMTAFRKKDALDNPDLRKERHRKNRELEAEIKASGLTYVKAMGRAPGNRIPEEVFCVVNNRYAPADFQKLVLHWCSMFDQDDVLMTVPDPVLRSDGHPNAGKPIDVIGRWYNKSGGIDKEFHHAALEDAEKFFAHVYGSGFVLTAAAAYKTPDRQIYQCSGRVLAVYEFEEKYPYLAE